MEYTAPPPMRGRRKPVVALVIVIIVLAASFAYVALAYYPAVVRDVADQNGELRDDLTNLNATYNRERTAVAQQTLGLVLSLWSKLAAVSKEKEQQTAIAAFGVMSTAFTVLAQTTAYAAQHTQLCLNNTVQSAFSVRLPISQNYTTVCEILGGFADVAQSFTQGETTIEGYLIAAGQLVLAIAKLDNAISGDP